MEIIESGEFTGTVKVGDYIVAQANAQISSDHRTNSRYSESINDYKLYIENKEECRRQLDEFKAKVREREDVLIKNYHPEPEVEETPEPEPEEELPE